MEILGLGSEFFSCAYGWYSDGWKWMVMDGDRLVLRLVWMVSQHRTPSKSGYLCFSACGKLQSSWKVLDFRFSF